MPQYNTMSLRDTYGQGVADREASERHKLSVDASKQQMDMNRQSQSAAMQRRNTEMLLAGMMQVRQNPQAFPAVADQLSRAGIIDPKSIPELGQRIQQNPSILDQQIAGLQTALGQGPTQGNDPSAIKEYKFAKSQGYEGSFADWKSSNKGGVNINQYPAPEKGYRYVMDDKGQPVSMEPIPGGSAARDIQAEEDKISGRREEKTQEADIVLDEVSRAFERISPNREGLPATGRTGAIVGAMPDWMNASSNRKQLDALSTTIKANIGFSRLQQMRANSPTGGALGQVSDSEREALNATAGNLDANQPAYMYAYNLGRLYNKYNDVIHGAGNGDRWRAPESDYKMLFENSDNPAVVQRFQEAHGYLPPGF